MGDLQMEDATPGYRMRVQATEGWFGAFRHGSHDAATRARTRDPGARVARETLQTETRPGRVLRASARLSLAPMQGRTSCPGRRR